MHFIFAETKLQVDQNMGKTVAKLYYPLFILISNVFRSENDHKFLTKNIKNIN